MALYITDSGDNLLDKHFGSSSRRNRRDDRILTYIEKYPGLDRDELFLNLQHLKRQFDFAVPAGSEYQYLKVLDKLISKGLVVDREFEGTTNRYGVGFTSF